MSPYVFAGLDRIYVDRVFVFRNTSELITNAVLKYFEQPKSVIYSKSRIRAHVIVRQVTAFFLRRETDLSFKEIGLLLGGKDHSTAMHCVRAVKDLIDIDDEIMKSHIHKIKSML